MKISRHAYQRLQQRSLDVRVLRIIEELVLPVYRNQSQQIFLKRKDAIEIAGTIRRLADRVEKAAGTQLILDPYGSTLITIYRNSR